MLRLFTYSFIFVMINLLLAVVTNLILFRTTAILAGFALIGLYLLLRRSQPPQSGSLRLPGLEQEAEVGRDEHGLPQISAGTIHDLYLVQGFVTAQERFWQMEISRRTAAGRLAELLGDEYLERDRHFRSLGLYRAAADSLPLYSPEAMAHLEAYAAGVNAYLAERRLPPELTYLRATPEPWDVVDSLAIAKLMAYELSSRWTDDLFRAQLTSSLGPEKVAALYGDEAELEALQALDQMGLPYVEDLFRLHGANPQTLCDGAAVLVAGTRTESGAPLFGSSLQTAPQIPAPLFPCHLFGPDYFEVTGASLPGIPGIFVGQNRGFAWGFTRASFRNQELILEQPDPSTPGLFAFQGGWEPARRITEEIRVRGRQEPVSHEVVITRHGPILASDSGAALALRSTVLQPSAEVEALLKINRARNYEQFQGALQQITAPPLVALYAGYDGTIARQVVGAEPIRPYAVGWAQEGPSVPVPGWTGRHEWQGFTPFDQLPATLNPTDGLLLAPGLPADPYLFQGLTARLAASTNWNRERLEAVLTETIDLQARSLLQPLLGALQEGLRQGPQPEGLSQLEKQALLLLSGWEHDEPATSAPPLLWHQWYLFLVEEIYRPQMGLGPFHQFAASGHAHPLTDRLLHQVTSGEESSWLTLEGEAGLPRIALRSFRRTVALLAAKHGDQPEKWRWGQEHRITFSHGLSPTSRLLAHLLESGPYPLGGSHSTIARNSGDPLDPFTIRRATTYRQIIDLGISTDRLTIVTPGVSGHPLSPHYADQLPLWLKDQHTQQPLRRAEIRKLPRLQLLPKE